MRNFCWELKKNLKKETSVFSSYMQLKPYPAAIKPRLKAKA